MTLDAVHALLRFAHYSLLLGLFGAAAFRYFGLRRSCDQMGQMPISFGMSAGALAASILSAALMLVSISMMMAQPVLELDWATITAILTTTDLGWAFLARIGFLLAATGTCLMFARTAYANAIAASWFGLAIATLAYSGHAAAGEGLLGHMHRLNDMVHLLASGYWLGAMGWFLYLTIVVHRTQNSTVMSLIADMRSFAPLGISLVLIVAGTGLANSHLIFGLENSLSVIANTYGQLLAFKILLVAAVISFAARNAWLVRRQALVADAKAGLAKLRFSLGGELLMAIVILGLVASMGTMSPARY